MIALTIGHKTMNRLLNHIIKERKGHYCHALELDSTYSLECVIEQIVSDYKDSFTLEEIISFFSSISLYFYYDADSDDEEHRLTEEQQEIAENELYAFDYIQCINDCYY